MRTKLFGSVVFAALFELQSAAPYPQSPVIKAIEWAPKETIRRAAKGSDRFPMTWANDDAQYTAWGDGKGFGNIEKKLSLGYARIKGGPDAFKAEDIRSATGEDVGDGRRGLKACGLLSISGTLYMWIGNADRNGRESRLAWSTDKARTWTWAEWRFPEFGYISLVNFGRDTRERGTTMFTRWGTIIPVNTWLPTASS